MASSRFWQNAVTRRVQNLIDVMDVEHLGSDVYRGVSQKLGLRSVYGGQVLGQALASASKSITAQPANTGMLPHSMHAYFLRPGDVQLPIDYTVKVLRDGRNFSARSVRARQLDKTIFIATASFQRQPTGHSFNHAIQMPTDVPSPEEANLGPAQDLWLNKFSDDLKTMFGRDGAIDYYPFKPRGTANHLSTVKQCAWLRVKGEVGPNTLLHQCILAYATDFHFLATSLVEHNAEHWDREGMHVATIDHTIWFCRPFNVDDWLLYVMDSPSAENDRGLVRGILYNQEGMLVASTAQEGLIKVTNAKET